MMFNREKQIKSLDKKVTNALSIFNRTIADLEKSNEDYIVLKSEVNTEITELQKTAISLDLTINENKKILEKFKNLLK